MNVDDIRGENTVEEKISNAPAEHTQQPAEHTQQKDGFRSQVKRQKDDMRAEYRAKRLALSVEERADRDRRICEIASSLVSFRYADIVLMYAPTGEEIDILPLANIAFERGKRVAFPRCDTVNRTMTYRFVKSLDDLKPDAYNIREPGPDAEIYDPVSDCSPAICFVPGLVYDRRGYRLGYGKGFYDRYLGDFHGGTLGVIYSDFIVNSVPRGRFDLSVDILLTEKGVRIVNK